ncbi:hypothetical protein [Streptococcus oricebi]|uniref:Secreted protein n=1 Tax=Streptococcus oricebi TaxID=1547447 RepID=A0ABS5B5A5_9STRE|nr:hypothetical protein [Streptococcus oricebi]MBP2623985.1 hypothetical protein [Streptococcus oricebi]
MKSKKIWLIIVPLVLIALIIGGFVMWQNKVKEDEKQALKRNRKYEVSLVKALKNSYSGIEEIRISYPVYSSKPSDSWGADVKIIFSNNESVQHEMAYDLKSKEIRIGVYNEQDEKVEAFLNARKGVTTKYVVVIYSSGKKGEQ